MPVRTMLLALALAIAGTCGSGATERSDRGRELLRRHCAACHAIDARGASPHPAAPPFRSIGRRLDLDRLAGSLRELLVSTHRDMPSFRFSRREANAIRAYLLSIQE